MASRTHVIEAEVEELEILCLELSDRLAVVRPERQILENEWFKSKMLAQDDNSKENLKRKEMLWSQLKDAAIEEDRLVHDEQEKCARREYS